MSALILLALASVELTPPPVVEVGAAEKAPEVTWDAPAPAVPEWNLGAQVAVTGALTLNGAFLGVSACGALYCYSGGGAGPFMAGVMGAGAGFAYSLLDRELSRGWGRAVLIDSLAIAGALGSIVLATRPELGLSQGPGMAVIFLTDLVVVAGASLLARYVAPRPEAVLLADSLGLWGILLGSATATLLRQDPPTCILVGALAGGASGALLAASAQRVTMWRFLSANALALAGALVLGGGLAIYESLASSAARRPYDPAVPAAGVAAGAASGFLIGFAFSEPL